MTKQNKNNGNKEQKTFKEIIRLYYTDRSAYKAAFEYNRVEKILNEFCNYFKEKDREIKSFEDIGQIEAVEYYFYLSEKYRKDEEIIKEHMAELSKLIVYAIENEFVDKDKWAKS